MIGHETVEGILAVLEVVVILAGVFRIDGVVDFFGMSYQVIDVVDAVQPVDGVSLNEGCKLEIAFLNPLNRIGTLSLTLELQDPGVCRVLRGLVSTPFGIVLVLVGHE